MAALGYIGEKLDLLIRQGATLGPFTAQMVNPDNSSVNLTGCELRAQIRKKALDPTVVTPITVSITEPISGQYVLGLSAELTAAIIAGESIKDPASKYVWDMELVDSTGQVLPIYYGDVTVFREVTRA
jgi:hypothetical protein